MNKKFLSRGDVPGRDSTLDEAQSWMLRVDKKRIIQTEMGIDFPA